MKGRSIGLGDWRGRNVAVMTVDGRIEDVFWDPPASVPRIGSVYAVRVDRSLRGQGGHIVRLPDWSGYLKGGAYAQGDVMLAQVSGYAEPGKAVPMTAKIALRGRFIVVTPGAPGLNVSRKIADPERRSALTALVRRVAPNVTGAIVRSAAATADDDAIASELARFADQLARLSGPIHGPELHLPGASAHTLAKRDWPAGPSEDLNASDDLQDALQSMTRPQVHIGAGHAFIEPTRACVAVDVNTGADISPASSLKANLALANDLPRQLRCRGLGGQVVVDFAPASRRDRDRIEAALRGSFAKDDVATDLLGWTKLGHFELSRHRTRWPLYG